MHDEAAGVTALIDWSGATHGPVLYDVASAVMYLGGPEAAAPFLATYRAASVVDADELAHLDTLRRLRFVVQGTYFARRLAIDDRTGLTGRAGNEEGLAHARRGLARLGVDTGPGPAGAP